jgi:hypothetical protein
MTPDPIVIGIIVVVALVVGAVLYLRKHPDAKAKLEPVLGEVKTDATNALGKLVDSVRDLAAAHKTTAETNAAQAAVIASPPVQAAINAQPAVPVAAVAAASGGAAQLVQSASAANAPTSAPTAQAAGALASTGSGSGPASPTPAAPDVIVPQIDPVVPAGTAGTVTVEATGHVLSLPAAGESLMSYARRVSVQAHGDVAFIPLLLLGGGPANQADWPAFVDNYFAAAVHVKGA